MIPAKFLTLTADYAVSGHKPPLPPIDLRPVWPPQPPLEHWEIQLEDMARQQRLNDAERIWAVTEQIAQSTNVSVPLPMPRVWTVVEGDTGDEQETPNANFEWLIDSMFGGGLG